MDPVSQPQPRPRCDRCRKPASLCLCARIERVANRTHVLVVQHRRERTHAVGTARIVRLGLAQTEIVASGRQVPRPDLRRGAALLYPGPASRELASLAPQERPEQLVVLDGTWNHARRLFLDNAWIRDLPRVRLSPEAPSRYRIRRQPAEHCISTLESIVVALRILEPDISGLDGLLEAFDSMIDEQQAYMASPNAVPRFRERKARLSRAIPEELRGSPERAVVVYGETSRTEPSESCGTRQIVRWCALRPGDGSVLDCLVRPTGAALPDWHLAHMGLAPGQLERAGDLDQAREAWHRFARPDDLVVAWHPAMSSLLELLTDRPSAALALRGLWANISHRRPGGLEALVQRLALPVQPVAIPGRAAARLGHAAAILEHLLQVAPLEVHR